MLDVSDGHRWLPHYLEKYVEGKPEYKTIMMKRTEKEIVHRWVNQGCVCVDAIVFLFVEALRNCGVNAQRQFGRSDWKRPSCSWYRLKHSSRR